MLQETASLASFFSQQPFIKGNCTEVFALGKKIVHEAEHSSNL